MAAVGTATLPDDVILEILSRVANGAVATLFLCTVACKSWRALVADPCFLHSCWPRGIRHPPSFLGVFEQSSLEGWISGPPTFVSVTPTPLGPSHGFPASFDPSSVCSQYNPVPLASRQGLLLVQLRRQTCLELALCDMFAGTCDVLPPPNCAYFSIMGSVMLTHADYCPNQGQSQLTSYSNNFKVLVMVHEYTTLESHPRLYSFSSAESSWKSFDLVESSISHTNLVVCRGKVHWLFEIGWNWNLYEFDLSNETSHGSLKTLSMPWGKLHVNSFNTPCLNATIDGKLLLLVLCTQCHRLEIWTHQGEKESGDGTEDWLCTKVIELKPKTKTHSGVPAGMWMGERTGTLLFRDQHNPVYSVNLETGTIDDVPSQIFSQGSYNAVPFEIDWSAFFMYRLESRGS